MGVSRGAGLHFSPTRPSPRAPLGSAEGVGGGAAGGWRGLWEGGSPDRPPPAWLLTWEEPANLELPQGRFFFGRLPHPHFIEEILGAQRRTQLARATPRPLSGSSPSGSREAFVSHGWVAAAKRQGRLSPSRCQPPEWSVGTQAPAAKVAA